MEHTNGSHVCLLLLYMNDNLKEWMGHWENPSTGKWVEMGMSGCLSMKRTSEKKWLERHGIREDSIHLRETHSRIKDKQRGKYRGGKSIMNHLYDVEMTWWSHGKGAWKMSLKLFLLSLTALVHGLHYLFTFSSVTSDGIKKLHEEL